MNKLKTVEVRRYPLGHHQIAHAHEELFLIETPVRGKTGGAEIGDVAIDAPCPKAHVLGTITFSSCHLYEDLKAWNADRQKHRIRVNKEHDWNGKDLEDIYAWKVLRVRCFAQPVAIPERARRSQLGFQKFITLECTEKRG